MRRKRKGIKKKKTGLAINFDKLTIFLSEMTTDILSFFSRFARYSWHLTASNSLRRIFETRFYSDTRIFIQIHVIVYVCAVAGECVKYNGVDNTMENAIRTSWIWIFCTDTRGWPSACETDLPLRSLACSRVSVLCHADHIMYQMRVVDGQLCVCYLSKVSLFPENGIRPVRGLPTLSSQTHNRPNLDLNT